MSLPRESEHLQAILLFESGVKDMRAWVCQAQSASGDLKAAGDPGAVKRVGVRLHR